MKILLLTEYFPDSSDITGGVEARVYNICKGLSKNHKVKVICSTQPNQKSKKQNIDVLRLGPVFEYSATKHLLKRFLFGIHVALRIPFLIKDFDIVDGYSFFVYPAAIVAKTFGKKSFLTYHEVWLGKWTKNTRSKLGVIGEVAERMILLFSRLLSMKFIAVSRFTKKKLINSGINGNNVVIINNGIVLKKYQYLKVKKFDTPAICYVGRLVDHKRIDDLIRAIVLVKKDLPNIQCNIIGYGPEKNKLIEFANKCKLDNNVKFLGYIEDHNDVIKIIKSSHLLCHPGTVEGFGITLVEAMASGTPYVCSDIDVFKEITDDGKGGLIFNAGNFEDLAQKILFLLKNYKVYRSKVEEGKKYVQKYDWNKIIMKIVKEYKKDF